MPTDPDGAGRAASSELSHETSMAATACMEAIAQLGAEWPARAMSPWRMGQRIAKALATLDPESRRAAVISGDAGDHAHADGLIAAWPLRYLATARHAELPLVYLLRTGSMTRLRTAFLETPGRGIFLNTTEAASRWPNGMRPEVPLWLAGFQPCIPYDAADAQELGAIVRAALRSLYVEGEQAYYYVNLHDQPPTGDGMESASLAEAGTGMYFLKKVGAKAPRGVSLLGAGQALQRVMRAAQLLHQDWGIASDIWSCPSYTRLAREARQLEQWNTLHPQALSRRSRLAQCLDGGAPVIAVTDYGRHVAQQIGAHVAAPFLAIGADAVDGSGVPRAEWIALQALRLLAHEEPETRYRFSAALRKYGYAQDDAPPPG